MASAPCRPGAESSDGPCAHPERPSERLARHSRQGAGWGCPSPALGSSLLQGLGRYPPPLPTVPHPSGY